MTGYRVCYKSYQSYLRRQECLTNLSIRCCSAVPLFYMHYCPVSGGRLVSTLKSHLSALAAEYYLGIY